MISDARPPFTVKRWASRSFGCSTSIAFIRVADGVEGHTQVIGLFNRDRQASGDGQTWDGWNPRLSTLHHFAIEISLSEYENVLQYLRAQKLDPSTAVHDWSSIAFRSQRAPLTNGG